MEELIGNENELREKLCKIMRKDPQSLREYTRRIFIDNTGGHGVTLRNFLNKNRKSTFITLLRIKNFVDLTEKQEDVSI